MALGLLKRRSASAVSPSAARIAADISGTVTNSQIAVGEKIVQHNYGPGSTINNVAAAEAGPPRARAKSVSQLPRDVPRLHGRARELERARGAMRRGEPMQFVGASGLGKTALLRHLSHRPDGRFPDGVVYYRSRRESLDDLLMHIFEFLYEPAGATRVKPTSAEIGLYLGSTQALFLLDDSALRARLMGRLSAAYAYAGQPHVRHRDIAEAAVSMARRAGDKHTLADVLATTYWATRGPDDPDRHQRVACEVVQLAGEVDDPLLLAYGHGWVISHQLERGDLDAALRELHELRRLARMRNDRLVRWLLAAIEGVYALNDGQLERAEALAIEALGYWADQPQLDAPGGSPAAPRLAPPLQVFGAQMIFVRREQGRLGELVGLVAAYAAEHVEVAAWRCALAHIHAQLGDRAAATGALESVGDPKCLPRNGQWLLSMTFVAGTAALIDDLARCRQAYDMLLPYADTCLVALAVMCDGSISRLLGILATALGRYATAEAHFERALRTNEAIRSPLWTAHTQRELARMLQLRDGSGDDARARTLLSAAQVTADELGLTALGQRIRASRCQP
jgi:tetratricopeptide (TPR) repeat protein